jgi:hypothetical protein
LRFVVEMAVKYPPGLPTSATEDMQRRDAHTSRPEGLVTRGKTAPNRLRRVDHFCLAYDPQLIRRLDGPYARALFVDLGYGEDPDTALESARRFRRLNPELGVLGVEIEAERVERAQPHADGHTHFRLGGFNLPLRGKESVRMIRAFNVLRQYEEAEALPAIERLAGQMLPGGLLVEGTSDPFGRVWTANLVRRQEEGGEGAWNLEALVLGANLGVDLDPEAFQTRLPKSFIHRMVEGERVFTFIEDFKAAFRDTRSSAIWGPRAWFTATGGALVGRGYNIARPDRWLRQGWLVWRDPDLQLARRAG